jgi:phenylalanyl-tRNA synthetase beta chain
VRIPVSWLREFVDVSVDAARLAHDLTMSGTKIEAVHGGEPDFTGVWVGKVLETKRHPGADRLTLCRVEVAGEVLSIVCGAPNVRAGLTVAVAKVGARLPGDLRIRKSKIRGETSEGMICSARELGLGQDSDGILELGSEWASGTDFATVAGGGGDVVLEAEITPNRPDCLSIEGIAREVAALYGLPLRRMPVWRGDGARQPALVPVAIESDADCGRYVGRVLHGIRIAPSPDWLQARLVAAGSNPINNVVDITNYVMLETGQPLHAFDLERLAGPRIAVRRARAGEMLRTLDGVERRLDPSILVIADAERAVALAGIMGGDATAVRDSTRTILLEAAYFDPALVRAGRRKLGLSTDASYRFERQADLEAASRAADRATHLFVEVCAAEVRHETADVAPGRRPAAAIDLRVERCNRVIGTALAAADMAALLGRIELAAEPAGDRVRVVVPSFRRDLLHEIDLVEEVARLHGYDNIPADVVPPAPIVFRANPHIELLGELRRLSVGLGYTEVRTSAFMEQRDPDRLALAADDPRRRAVRLANPIVATLDTMRTSLVPGMLRVARHNRNHDQEALRFAQVDRVFTAMPGPLPGLPTETEAWTWVACGDAVPAGWAAPARPVDVFDLKGDVEAAFAALGVDTTWVYGYTEPFLDESTSFVISGTYGVVGRGGAVRGEVLQAFDLEPPVFVLEVDVAMLERHLPGPRRQRAIPRFPAVKRDLSVVVPAAVRYADVHAAATAAAGAQLESLQCFDVFTGGAAAGSGERSLGLRLRFRDPSRTLTDADVAPVLDRVVRRLADELKVTLRAGG